MPRPVVRSRGVPFPFDFLTGAQSSARRGMLAG